MDDLISRQAAIDALDAFEVMIENGESNSYSWARQRLTELSSAQPEIIRCKDCKHNPKDTWFECPMSHLSEKQRPETAWCWKGERRTDA